MLHLPTFELGGASNDFVDASDSLIVQSFRDVEYDDGAIEALLHLRDWGLVGKIVVC